MMDFSVQHLDESLFEWTFIHLSPDWLVSACDLFVQNINLYPVLLVFFIFYFRKDAIQAGIFLAAVLVLLGLSENMASLLKFIFQRPRPASYLGIHTNIALNSFPSAHAFNTMAQAVLWTFWLGYRRGLFFGISLSVGVARTLAHYHFPGDIAGGWLFGLVFGLAFVYLLNFILQKNEFLQKYIPSKTKA